MVVQSIRRVPGTGCVVNPDQAPASPSTAGDGVGRWEEVGRLAKRLRPATHRAGSSPIQPAPPAAPAPAQIDLFLDCRKSQLWKWLENRRNPSQYPNHSIQIHSPTRRKPGSGRFWQRHINWLDSMNPVSYVAEPGGPDRQRTAPGAVVLTFTTRGVLHTRGDHP